MTTGPARRRRPRYSPQQLRRRRLVALAILIVIVLLMGSCTVAVIRAVIGTGTEGSAPTRSAASAPPVARGDDAAMTVTRTADGARAHSQLLKGVPLASDETIGVDVSAHQRQIDWAKVAGDGYTFAYIKATEGVGHVDERFAENWKGARAAGLAVGAYHYFTLCSPGAEQAAHFLATATPDDTALPPVLDLEFDGACEKRPSRPEAESQVRAFVEAVEKRWGRKVVIYASTDWRRAYGLEISEGRPDWYYADHGRPQDGDWAVWQLRFTGRVSGIEGRTDIDVLRVERLREQARLEG